MCEDVSCCFVYSVTRDKREGSLLMAGRVCFRSGTDLHIMDRCRFLREGELMMPRTKTAVNHCRCFAGFIGTLRVCR